jgi:hypothetical protein
MLLVVEEGGVWRDVEAVNVGTGLRQKGGLPGTPPRSP